MASLHRALLPALILLGACGGEDSSRSNGGGRFLRPELRLVEAEQDVGEGELTERLALPTDPAEWGAEGREATILEGSDGTRRIVFARGAKPVHLHIEGNFPSRDLSQVRLRGVFPRSYRVQLQLGGGDTRPVRPGAIITRAQNGEQGLVFNMAMLRGTAHAYTTLDLLFVGPKLEFELRAIELVHIPLHAQLPEPHGPERMIELESDARSGLGLARNRPLECRFRVEHAGDRLGFALGIPPSLRPHAGKPRVRVTLTVEPAVDGGERQVIPATVVDLEDGSRPSRWHDMTLPLAEYVGHEVVARFEYECDDEWPGICGIANVTVWRPADHPRSVLLVSSDTHRGDHLGVAGTLEIETPGIDGLAQNGLFFERCWSTTNVTSPSHVAMLTGVHPRDTRLVTNQDRLSDRARTLAEAFREAGWATLAVVSVRYLGPRGTDLGQGFDRILSPVAAPWTAGVATQAVENWMEDFAGRPVFVFLHVFDAHHPYEPPASYDRYYYPRDRGPADPALPETVAQSDATPKHVGEGGLRNPEYLRAQYKAEITYLDSELATLFEHPRFLGGLTVVTADHGEILEKAGSIFNHGELYPDTLHVPLVLGGALLPSEFRGRRSSVPVTHLDLGRTLLDLAGLTPVDFPGRNLLASVEAGAADEVPRFALAAHALTASITFEGWHLLLHLKTRGGTHPGEKHQLQLFDLGADPECLKDVGEHNPDRRASLRKQLVDWLAEADGTGLSVSRTATSAEVAELAALGYATDMPKTEGEAWYDPDSK